MTDLRGAIFLVLLLAGALDPEPAAACTCVEPRGTEQQKIRREIRSYPFIAEVEVISTETVVIQEQDPSSEQDRGDGKYYALSPSAGYSLLRATVKVKTIWKGRAPTVIQVLTPSEESACGLPFAPGQKVLLYAAAPDREGKTAADLCSRTQLVATADSDLQALRRKYPRRHLTPDATVREP